MSRPILTPRVPVAPRPVERTTGLNGLFAPQSSPLAQALRQRMEAARAS